MIDINGNEQPDPVASFMLGLVAGAAIMSVLVAIAAAAL